jgi:hypothetical protein
MGFFELIYFWSERIFEETQKGMMRQLPSSKLEFALLNLSACKKKWLT